MGTAFVRLSLAFAAMVATFAQTGSPAFEVATIKPDHSSDRESGEIEHGRYTIHHATMRHLVGAAFNIPVDLVKGGPNWVDDDRFDVAAKADPATSESTSRLMLATLLTERCKLAVHHAAPPTSVFVLTVGKRGSKLRPATDDPARRQGCFGNDPMICHKVKMPRLIDVLKYAIRNTPVVDETGLDGFYDFELSYATPAASEQPGDAPVVWIFAAVEQQLGLKLEAAKRPIDTIVIDHVERPVAEN